MKVVIRWFYPVCVFLLCSFAQLLAQKSTYTPEKWAHMEERWLASQPVIMAYTKAGEVVSGQQIHADSDSLYILQHTGFPVGPDWQKNLVSIQVNDLIQVLFQAGGNKLGRKKQATTLRFPTSNAVYSEPHVFLRNESVYVDSLYNPLSLEDAFMQSNMLRRAFRKKRFRYSFGVNFGGDVVVNEIQKAIGQSPLPYASESWGGNVNGEFLDLSVRFFDRLITGVSLFSRSSSTSVYGNSYNEVRDIGYDYHVDFMEHNVYAEYAIIHTDRYFSRKFEVIAGAGLLLARPEWRFGFTYWDVQHPDYESDPYLYVSHRDKLLGVQLKGAFHYYFFPGFSFWTALNVNLNQPFVVPEQELPTSEGQDPILLPTHELGFSSVRFKLGLSLYL